MTIELLRSAPPAVELGSLVEFLRQGTESVATGEAVAPALREDWAAFLGAGLAGLRAVRPPAGWVQLGLTPAPGASAGLHLALAGLVEPLLASGGISEFFFMHKHPGLRVRLCSGRTDRTGLRELLLAAVTGWADESLVTGWEHGVYEPEYLLFGGPDSMREVHRAFTADALVWTRVHAAGAAAGPAWAIALLLTRELLGALEISGWERLDVADRLRRQTGREASPELLARPEVAAVLDRMVAAWERPAELRDLLPEPGRLALRGYAEAVTAAFDRWRRDYLNSPQALVGPRELAAFLLIFLWNRAALPALHQQLLTEMLAERPGGRS